MMKYIVYTAAMLVMCVTQLSAQGIQFEKGTFEEALAKAKSSKKLLFVDVYAEWCGPCKQMDKQVFPKKEIGDYYNKNFINFKIDGESEAGKVIVSKYDIKGYPAHLFINAKEVSLVSKELGGVDVKGLLKRGQDAIDESKDTKTWKEYEKELSKKNTNKEFLERYILRGNKLGENVDEAIDHYVDNFKPAIPTEEFITFLSYNIKTLCNKGIDYVVSIYSEVPEGVEALEGWLPEMYDNTLDRAVATKDIKKVERILWAAKVTKNPQATHLYQRYLTTYYEKLADWPNFWTAVDNEINLFKTKSIASYRQEDSLAYALLVNGYIEQLQQYGVPDDEHMDYINEQTKDKMEARYQSSYMAAASIEDVLNKVLEIGKNDQALVSKSVQWADYMLELSAPMDVQWAYFGITASQIYALNKDTEKAKTTLNTALEKANTQPGIRTLILEEMRKY